MVSVQEKLSPIEVVFTLWTAERAAVVGDNVLTVLPLLRQYRIKTYIAGLLMASWWTPKWSFWGLDRPAWGPRWALPGLYKGSCTVFPLTHLAPFLVSRC